jgi:hypothetical protein
MSSFVMGRASVLNHIELAAVPNQGVKQVRANCLPICPSTSLPASSHHVPTTLPPPLLQVRIHYLLALLHVAHGQRDGQGDAVETDDAGQVWNFTELDAAMDLLRSLSLSVGFELMGNPDGVFSDWREPQQVVRWGAMVGVVARRYTRRYGLAWTRTWRFEPWNEPDHACNLQRKLDVGIACDLPSWLATYAASSYALAAVSDTLQLGGPNTGGSTLTSSPSFLDRLLQRVNASRHSTTEALLKLDFISWHHKGTVELPSGQRIATSQRITTLDLEIVEHIKHSFPALAHVPVRELGCCAALLPYEIPLTPLWDTTSVRWAIPSPTRSVGGTRTSLGAATTDTPRWWSRSSRSASRSSSSTPRCRSSTCRSLRPTLHSSTMQIPITSSDSAPSRRRSCIAPTLTRPLFPAVHTHNNILHLCPPLLPSPSLAPVTRL